MARVLILNPPSKEGIYINRDQMGGMGQKLSFGKSLLTSFLSKMKSSFIHQPVLQLVYAASILVKNHDVLVIDALNEGVELEKVLVRAKKFNPDYTIIAVSSSDILFERDVVSKKIKEETNSKIISVGDTICNAPSLFKEPFDIAIVGEIEKSIHRIVSGEKLDRIPGIFYFSGKNVKETRKEKLIDGAELDVLPFPRWDLFPYKKYRYYPLLLKEPVVSMLSSRGCPYGCYYCSYSKNEGKILRMRSPENVVSEMENNSKMYGIKGVVFRDPLFTGSKKRTEEICRLLIKKKINLIWVCETRPELLDEKLLKLMHHAGCRAINLGVESIHEKELKAVGRNKLDVQNFKKVVSACKKIGIRVTCFFILGLPESTRKSIGETIEFSQMEGINHAEYKIATPYPGTKLREMAIKNKWIKEQDLKDLGGYDAVMEINQEINKDYLNSVCDSAFKQFYYRPKWIRNELSSGNIAGKVNMMIKGIFRAMFS